MKCAYKDKNKACRANAMRNSQFCFHHNPDITDQEKKAARIKGGKANRAEIERSKPEMSIKTTQDVALLLAGLINDIRAGEIDIRIANCIGYLSGHLLKAMEVSELSKRLEAVEETLNQFKNDNTR